MALDYRRCAEEIAKHIGGGSNVISAAHCTTRLRLVIADNSKLDKKALEEIEGVNYRFMKPFLFGMVGGAVGALCGALFGLGAPVYGVTGIPAIPAVNKTGLYILQLAISAGVAFLLTVLLWKEEKPAENKEAAPEKAPELPTAAVIRCSAGQVIQPVAGTVIAREAIPDETFAAGILGDGVGIQPEDEGREVIIDGSLGAVLIDADETSRQKMLLKLEEQKKTQALLDELKGKENRTLDGQEVRIYCNIGSPDDVHNVLKNDAGGVGLFRSEFLYLNCDDYPDEEYQFKAYKKALSDMEGREVVIRTLDIGADKQIEYFHMPKEENPALGNRALRICLNRPETFKTQLRAMYRASAYGKLSIMFPMVASVWEVKEAKKVCEQVKKELTEEGIPFSSEVDVGIMIETPAAAVISDRLAKEVDFFSIGTNDLTQYTLACDRQNNDLGRFFNAHHHAVLRLIKMVCENAHKNGIWVGICGELGADLALTELFLSIGIDELSVSPPARYCPCAKRHAKPTSPPCVKR